VKTLFLDCEFDGFNGPLLSMALVGNDCEWYEVLEFAKIDDPWVALNVVPHLNKAPKHKSEVQQSLQQFLANQGACMIIADWPDDIKYFCQLLITKPGYAINTPPLSFVLDRSIEYVSKIPHNALEDARAIMESYKA
jgi:hypothetical protein